jgi:hypothetical protein
MNGVIDSASARLAGRRRHLDAGVVAEMARALHRDAGRERERSAAGRHGGRGRELARAIEAGRVHRGRAPRPRRGAPLASPSAGVRATTLAAPRA